MTALDAAAVRAVDTTGQVAEALDLATHLRDALWRVDSAAVAPIDAPGGLIVSGMGGSSVGGRLAAGALGARLVRPLHLAMDYDVPAWTGPDTLVLCSSYSGDTAETLSAYDRARDAGAPRLVATTGGGLAARARADGVPVVPLPGGFQPRAAVGYALVTALEAAALCGAAPSVRDEVEAAAVLAGQLAAEWAPDGSEDGDAKRIARALHGSIPVIVGAELTAGVAYRWKTQLNENAKMHAFSHALPELAHNEIVGWEGTPPGRFAAVFLSDPGQADAVRSSIEATARLIEGEAALVEIVEARGETPAARAFSLVAQGDWASYGAALRRGVDPTPVRNIDVLKQALTR